MSKEETFTWLPHQSQHNLPLTPAIPYYFRWKILNLKLLLADLRTLADKYNIENAEELYYTVMRETELECERIMNVINQKRQTITKTSASRGESC